jgi:proteic killer suppression protein
MLLDVYRGAVYPSRVIRSFRCADSELLFHRETVLRFKAFERQALRKLDMLDAAADIRTLATFPGNRLEALKGERKGQYSIRINDQWRIRFVWVQGHAYDVEIVDYH